MSDEKQPWEKLRHTVRVLSDAPDEQAMSSTEWRLNNLERRLATLETTMVKQLEQLTGAYAHICSSLDKMVAKHEFEPIKNLVFALCACLVTGVVAALFTRAFMK